MLQNKIFFAVVISLIISCATIEAPQGGPEDNMPPELLNIKTKEKKTILYFNENIKISNPQDIIFNTFPNPSITYNRKQVVIKNLPDSGKKTVILFSNSITDLNNNNTLYNYIYANNLGSDTFSIQGNLTPLLFNESLKNTYAILFSDSLNLANPNSMYNYNYTRTNDSGSYKLYFTPNPNDYKIFFFRDNNNNKSLDSLDNISPIFPAKDSSIKYLYPLKNKITIDTTKNNEIKTIVSYGLYYIANNIDLINIS